MKKWKSSMALLATCVVSATVFSACSNSNDNAGNEASSTPSATPTAAAIPDGKKSWEVDTSPITLDAYLNFSWFANNWTDSAAKEITKETGVSVKISKPVNDDDQKLNLMITSDKLPDIIMADKNSPAWNLMVEKGMLYSLDELAAQYAPELLQDAPKEAFTNYVADDKHTYMYVDFIEGEQYQEEVKKYNALVGTNQPEWSIRQDYLEEIGNPDISTPEAFTAALEQIKAKHPDKMGYYANVGDLVNDKDFQLGTNNMFGNYRYSINGDKIEAGFRSDKFKQELQFMNKLNTLDLLTKDTFIDTKDIFTQKINSGKTISYAWAIGEGTKTPSDNPNTSYKVMAPFDSYTQYRTGGGWNAFGIPKSNKHPERTIRFLAYMASKQGHMVAKWGVEGDKFSGDVVNGPHYSMVDGKPLYLPEYWEVKQKDWSGVSSKNGLGEYWFATNAAWWNEPEWNNTDPAFIEYNKMFGDKVKYVPELENLDPMPNSKEGIILKRVSDLYSQYGVKMIFAKSEEESMSIYEEFLKKADSLGLPQVEAYWTANYQKNAERMGK
ncbi:extracellular solute-binding protein [Paenibacillus glycanilyticus]|uniref:ABC transporter substrate-binding protein n=1 Tax=Paenibacillus glycanilyticus TaxID=126569 RepID=A0ABQ6GDU6_9BACL|nr:extracellular solute-binding protein [Paenibacillus glycanilyticus]GLX67237.1 ABC transporter substrate-binding protein [Paenibacillus glycanilyticus]